jgi:hypothetical protein
VVGFLFSFSDLYILMKCPGDMGLVPIYLCRWPNEYVVIKATMVI